MSNELLPIDRATEILKQANAEEAPVEPETAEVEAETQEEKIETEEPEEIEEETQETEDTSKEKDPFAPKFAALSRREKQVRQREQEVKELQEQMKEWQEKQELVKTDPLKFIESVGLSFEELSNRYVYGNDKIDNSPDKKVSNLEERLAKFEKQEQERLAQEEQANMKKVAEEYMNNLNKFVEESDFELIKATESQQLIVDTIVQHFNDTGEEMDIATASELVENYLEEQETKKIGRVLKLDKIRKKLALDEENEESDESQKTAEVEKAKTKQKPKKKTKTLSNVDTSAAPKREKFDDTEEGRLSRVEAILREANKH
jgi:hypothetical protein